MTTKGNYEEQYKEFFKNATEIEKWPYRGFIQFKVPTDEFEAMMWQV